MFREPCWECRKMMDYVCRDCGEIRSPSGDLVGKIVKEYDMYGVEKYVVEWVKEKVDDGL